MADVNVAHKNLETAITNFAKKLEPAVSSILASVKPEDLGDQTKRANIATHIARAVLVSVNLNVNSKVVIPNLGIVIGKPEKDKEEPEPVITCALPMFVTTNPPGFGDSPMMDTRIPFEFQPTIVGRVQYPFLGGHMMLNMRVWVENAEKANQCWAMYEKFLGAQRIDIPPEKKNEPAQAEGQTAVPPAGN